ncbi:MAG: hypothetical protein AAGE84_27380 [Cyanobacteria bacterium P01_G01_bin.39]
MINIKNKKVSFTLLNKGIGITCITIINTFFPLNAFAQEPNCVNFWTNPNTGENECFSSNMTVITEPKPVFPISYNSSFSDRYNIGGQQISVPNPDQYIRVTPEMDIVYRLYKSTEDPYHKLLASYISQSDAEIAMQGELPSLEKGFYLKVLKIAETESVTPQDFAKIKKNIKTQNQQNQASNLSKLQELAEENGKSMSKELGVDLTFNVSQAIPLDPHYESENTFSYSLYLVSQVSVMGEQQEYVMAATATLVNLSGKVVSLYSFGEQADLEWTQKASRTWSEKAIASNP